MFILFGPSVTLRALTNLIEQNKLKNHRWRKAAEKIKNRKELSKSGDKEIVWHKWNLYLSLLYRSSLIAIKQTADTTLKPNVLVTLQQNFFVISKVEVWYSCWQNQNFHRSETNPPVPNFQKTKKNYRHKTTLQAERKTKCAKHVRARYNYQTRSGQFYLKTLIFHAETDEFLLIVIIP